METIKLNSFIIGGANIYRPVTNGPDGTLHRPFYMVWFSQDDNPNVTPPDGWKQSATRSGYTYHRYKSSFAPRVTMAARGDNTYSALSLEYETLAEAFKLAELRNIERDKLFIGVHADIVLAVQPNGDLTLCEIIVRAGDLLSKAVR